MKILKRVLIVLLIIIILLFGMSFGFSVYSTMTHPVKYSQTIQKYSKEYNIDPLLVLAVIKVESNFETSAVSNAGAKGLMQMMPETAKSILKDRNQKYENNLITDPHKNIELGTYYLSYLLRQFHDRDLAIAAYNGGIGNVNKWLNDTSLSKDGETLHNIPLGETRYYVVKINNQYDIYRLFYGGETLQDDMHTSPQTWFKNYWKIIQNIIENY